MNIVLVSNNPQEGDALKRKLNEKASAIKIDAVLNSQNAFAYLSASSACDAILLDASVSIADAENLVSATRLTKKSMGIVALVGADEGNPPTKLIRAGVDKLIVKGSETASIIEEALLMAKDQHRSESASNIRQVRVIYAGDVRDFQPHLAQHPHWILEQAGFEPDGLLKLPEIGSSQDEVIIMDRAFAGEHILKAIQDIKLRTPDTPIILLAESEDEEIPVQAMRAGASDCVAKKGNYIQILLLAIEREAKRRQLIREKASLQKREESLRQVIETVPIGIAVISPDGTFLAINHAGLKLLGAGRLDQIIGKSIVRLLPPEERDKIISFLATINQGTATSTQIDWKGLDGTRSGTELHAVPMRRDPAGTAVALAVIAPLTYGQDNQNQANAQKQIEELRQALRESKAQYLELQNKAASKPSDWEKELKKFQTGQSAAEEQVAILKKTVEETEARYANLLEEQRAERASWEQARKSYKEQCAKIEGMAETLKTAQETLIETQDAERAEWGAKLQELEQKKKDVEDQLARKLEESQHERSQWNVARQELEQKLQAAEEQRSMLDAVLQEAQSGHVQLEENFSAERSEWDLARQDLEQKLRAVEEQRSLQDTVLQETQSKINQLEATLKTERSQWDLARQELEKKLEAPEKNHSEELQRALGDAESRIAAILDENRLLSTQMEEVRLEIEQLKAERDKLSAQLTKTHLQYQRLSQVSTVGLATATLDGQVLECNDAAAQMFGYAGAEEALAASDDDAFRIYAFEGILAARLQQEGRLDCVEWSSLGRDGRLVRLQENARLVEVSTGESPLVERVLTDITKIHRLGEEIRRTRRMESTGNLAEATVRSLKSLCTSLENCGNLLMGAPEDADAVRQTAETLLKNVRRGIKHSRQYLSISGKAERIPGLLNLNETLSDNEHLLHSLAGDDIDLQLLLSPGKALVTADQQELIQLISGLVASSREALPLGGSVTIETANAEVDKAINGHPAEAQPGIYIQMTVSADGCVVHPERRIASNRMIVERLGGWMATTNNTDRGNLHQVYLPRVEQFGSQAKSG